MAYNVTIERLDASTVIDIQGDATQVEIWASEKLPPLPAIPNTASNSDDVAIYWVGARRWLVRASIGQEEELLASLELPSLPADLSAVLVSDTLQFFSIQGPDAEDVMSIVSAVDFHPSVFPVNGVCYTDICGIKGLIVRQSKGFEISIERSYADMIEDYLSRVQDKTE